MSIGHVRPSVSFAKAVDRIESTPKPVAIAPVVQKEEKVNGLQGIEKVEEVRQEIQEVSVPTINENITDEPVTVSAWKEKIEAAKRAKAKAKAAKKEE